MTFDEWMKENAPRTGDGRWWSIIADDGLSVMFKWLEPQNALHNREQSKRVITPEPVVIVDTPPWVTCYDNEYMRQKAFLYEAIQMIREWADATIAKLVDESGAADDTA